MTSSHYCPEPGPKTGSTVVCGICRVSRQRALDGQVAVIPYGQTQPPKPGRQEWMPPRLPPPRGPRTIPLTPAPVPARHVTPPRTECVTCGMGDLPLDGAGLCTVCAQVAAFRHQARQPRTATGDMVLSYVCAVLTVLIMTLVVAWAWG